MGYGITGRERKTKSPISEYLYHTLSTEMIEDRVGVSEKDGQGRNATMS